MLNLDDLLYEGLRQLYDEEQRLVKALPKMVRNAASERLRRALQQHFDQTRAHVTRLEECFRDLGRRPGRRNAIGMEGLIEEGERWVGSIEQSPLRDAALIEAARRVEHYEIAAYSGAASFASFLGREGVGRLLNQTLQEEQETDRELAEIADHTVNQEALQLGAHQRV